MDILAAHKSLLNVDELPTLPGVVHRILHITGDPESSMDQLASVIERDPALAANLLHMVNSANFGFSRKIHTVRDATILLGYHTIRTLCLGTSVISSLDLGNGFNYHHFWQHSLATAISAGHLAREIDHEHTDQAFISGLLHDVGILLFALTFPRETESLYISRDDQGDQLPPESQVFGLTHTAAGGLVARHWKFSPVIIEAIEGHHLEEGLQHYDENSLAPLVHMAELLVEEQYPLGESVASNTTEIDQLSDAMGYDPAGIDALRSRLANELESVSVILPMDV